MPRVLIVSKPLTPPWNDSGKNLARDLISAGERYLYRYLVPPQAPLLPGPAEPEPIYAPLEKGFSLSYEQKARVLWRLMQGRADLFHFFFAPNPASSIAAKIASTVRQIPAIQTICSAPKEGSPVSPWLFGKKVVVLSQSTQRRLLQEGVAKDRLVYIPPGLTPPAQPTKERIDAVRANLDAHDRPIILFPGDYEVSQAAWLFSEAILSLRQEIKPTPLFVFACRPKTPKAAEIEAKLRQRHKEHPHLVRFLGDVSDIFALISASSVVTLPAEDLYAKMDIPLVLLEAMSLGVPILVTQKPPISEILPSFPGFDAGLIPGSAQDLLQKTLALLQSADLRAGLSEAGKEKVSTVYSAKAMAARYEALYDEVLERR